MHTALGVAGVSILGSRLESRVFPMSDSQLHSTDTANSALMMSTAADAFHQFALSGSTRAATFSFNDEQRFDWHFIPRARKGIPFKDLDSAQRLLGNALLGAGLGQRGLIRAATIMSLDAILREMEKGSGPVRDPELYFLSIFGDARFANPGKASGRTSRCADFTLVEGKTIASTPAFFGAKSCRSFAGRTQGAASAGS